MSMPKKTQLRKVKPKKKEDSKKISVIYMSEERGNQQPDLELKVGKKPVRAYITAVIVHYKQYNKASKVKVQARGRSISKAVDIAEILKRFESPKFTLKDITLSTEEFKVTVDKGGELYKSEKQPIRRVSTIEIVLKAS